MQRQRLNCNAFKISALLGLSFLVSKILVLVRNPGVQNPHCTAPLPTNALPRVCKRDSGRPSRVTTLLPATFFMGVAQARTAFSSTSTRQAPHAACPEQPSLAAVRFLSLRNQERSETFSSPVYCVLSPLSVSSIIESLFMLFLKLLFRMSWELHAPASVAVRLQNRSS